MAPLASFLLCLLAGFLITVVIAVAVVLLDSRRINQAAIASGLTGFRYERWGFTYVNTRHPEYPRYWSKHVTSHVEVGWPYRCVRTAEAHPYRFRGLKRRSQQLAELRRPMLAGLALDTAILGVTLWTVLFGPGILIRGFRGRRGMCPHCGYPIGQTAVCSECGRAHGAGIAMEP